MTSTTHDHDTAARVRRPLRRASLMAVVISVFAVQIAIFFVARMVCDFGI